jgi:hypothetical protein
VELEEFDRNPIAKVKWTPPKSQGRPAQTRPDSFRVYSGTGDNRLHSVAAGCASVIKKQNGPGPH